MSHVNELCHIWMSQVTDKCITSHWIECVTVHSQGSHATYMVPDVCPQKSPHYHSGSGRGVCIHCPGEFAGEITHGKHTEKRIVTLRARTGVYTHVSIFAQSTYQSVYSMPGPNELFTFHLIQIVGGTNSVGNSWIWGLLRLSTCGHFRGTETKSRNFNWTGSPPDMLWRPNIKLTNLQSAAPSTKTPTPRPALPHSFFHFLSIFWAPFFWIQVILSGTNRPRGLIMIMPVGQFKIWSNTIKAKVPTGLGANGRTPVWVSLCSQQQKQRESNSWIIQCIQYVGAASPHNNVCN